MNRASFLGLPIAAVAATGLPARGVAQYDPAQTSPSAALRVLLGPGNAVARGDGTFAFNGRIFRGTFARQPDGSIVNTVGVEEYLYSVVPREMSPAWPAAALAVQAICARTYVLQRSNPQRAYDLVPSEADQVYEGVAAESALGRSAVDATSGNVLRYADAFAEIMYSSCCGGHTEAASDAWGGASVPYLAGVACTYCVSSPNYQWTRDLALADVASRFIAELAPAGGLTHVRVSQVDGSGRARTIELAGTRGSAFVKGSVFRMRIGPRVVPSLLIRKIEATTEAPERITIEGGGLGHGVGLCQWGARGMAQTGASAATILNFYFPGTMIGHD